MRKALLVGVSALVLFVGGHKAGRAILGVGDIVFDPANLEEAVQQGIAMKKQIDWATRQFHVAESQYNSLRNARDPLTFAQRLIGLRNPLGDNARSVLSLLKGKPGGILGAYIDSNLIDNLVYENPADHWFAREQNERRVAIAGIQAAGEALLQEAMYRSAVMAELEAEIRMEDDPATRFALQNRLQVESIHLANINIKLNAVRLAAEAQEKNFQQRRTEAIQRELDRLVDALVSNRGWRFNGGGGGGGGEAERGPLMSGL